MHYLESTLNYASLGFLKAVKGGSDQVKVKEIIVAETRFVVYFNSTLFGENNARHRKDMFTCTSSEALIDFFTVRTHALQGSRNPTRQVFRDPRVQQSGWAEDIVNP